MPSLSFRKGEDITFYVTALDADDCTELSVGEVRPETLQAAYQRSAFRIFPRIFNEYTYLSTADYVRLETASSPYGREGLSSFIRC